MHLKLLFSASLLSLASTSCLANGTIDIGLNEHDLTELSFEELMQVEITSVSKKSEKLSNAAAAVYVVAQDEIRRSGATSIPEALRLVPGVDVAQVDPNKWAIGIRGFNGQFTNKLLVMIDGRSVFTPTFSGVYWENFDYLVKDIERIEVIRGPGATLWGTNATNGVINIITREAGSVDKATATAAIGNELRYLASLSLDHVFSDELKTRVYARSKKLDDAENSLTGEEQDNQGQYAQVGGRLDWQFANDQSLTVHANGYQNRIHQEHNAPSFAPPTYSEEFLADIGEYEGGNIQVEWNKLTGLNSEGRLTFNYDYYDRDEAITAEQSETAFIELQHQFSPLKNHDIVWGGGYKWSSNKVGPSQVLIKKSNFTQNSWNIFVQDSIELPQHSISFTAGVKLEGSDSGGHQQAFQPNLRVSWQPGDNSTVWGAMSRAKRIPTLAETSSITLTLKNYGPFELDETNPYPTTIRVAGQDDYEAEQSDSFELGWRWKASNSVALDLATFYNKYTDLRNYQIDLTDTEIELINQIPFLVLPAKPINSIHGHSQGFEFLARWQYNESTNFRLVYSYIDIDLTSNEEARYSGSLISADSERSPKNMASIWGSFDLSPDIDLDIKLFYNSRRDYNPTMDEASSNPGFHIDSAFNADIRLAWRPLLGLEMSLVGHNLLDGNNQEFSSESWSVHSQIERSLFLNAEYTW